MTQAPALLDSANQFYANSNWSEALQSYQNYFAAVDSAEPGARANAAVCKFRLGDTQTAVAELRQLTSDHPEFARGHLYLGNLAANAGLMQLALSGYKRAAELDADNPLVWYNLANLELRMSNWLAAEQHLRQAIALHGSFPAASNNLAHALNQQERYKDAMATLNPLLEQNPKLSDAWHNLGNSQRGLGDLQSAKSSFQKAVSHKPDNLLAALNLASIMRDLGEPQAEIAKVYQDIEQQIGVHQLLLKEQVEFQLETENYEGANALAQRLIEAAPQDPSHWNLRARVMRAMENWDLSLEASDKALSLATSKRSAQRNFALTKARTLVQAQRYSEARETLTQLLQNSPSDTTVLAELALLEVTNDVDPGIGQLLDFARDVRAVSLAEYDSGSAFNTNLAKAVMEHPSLNYAPPHHATRSGYHTGELADSEAFEPLIDKLRSAIESYRDTVLTNPDHPLHKAANQDYDISMWAVCMESAGHQIPHIHPSAWLSGVYYVTLPAAVGNSKDRAGWIGFGRKHLEGEWPRTAEQFYQPKVGEAFLFPSYYYHHTVPFESEQQRISIAFDVMPKSR